MSHHVNEMLADLGLGGVPAEQLVSALHAHILAVDSAPAPQCPFGAAAPRELQLSFLA